MAVKRFGVRAEVVLIRGMYMEILAKEMCICVQKERVNRSRRLAKRERGCQRLNECYNRVTPGDGDDEEWCLTMIAWLIGIDNVSCEQGVHHHVTPLE